MCCCLPWRSVRAASASTLGALPMIWRAAILLQARQHVGWMVSRQTEDLDAAGVASACLESTLENGNDAIFGALFWFALLGGPGALLFRLANTLDAMWGYRNPRFADFGWAAARIDDLLNFIPARLTALSYALCGRTRSALRCWREQGRELEEPQRRPGNGCRRRQPGSRPGRAGLLSRSS
jgi:adenosylcobinamide-phosphate synthase